MLQYLIRKWHCGSCGKSNATEVAIDGSVTCDHCAAVTQIQPSQAKPGETPKRRAAFIQADARTRQGEWANSEPEDAVGTSAVEAPVRFLRGDS